MKMNTISYMYVRVSHRIHLMNNYLYYVNPSVILCFEKAENSILTKIVQDGPRLLKIEVINKGNYKMAKIVVTNMDQMLEMRLQEHEMIACSSNMVWKQAPIVVHPAIFEGTCFSCHALNDALLVCHESISLVLYITYSQEYCD